MKPSELKSGIASAEFSEASFDIEHAIKCKDPFTRDNLIELACNAIRRGVIYEGHKRGNIKLNQ